MWKAGRGSTYEAKFPGESVSICFDSPEFEADSYEAALRRGAERLITIRADQKSGDWGLLEALYAEAQRNASGWDRAIDEIEEALKRGWRPQPPPATAGQAADDDIPF